MIDYLDGLRIDWRDFEAAAYQTRAIVKTIAGDKAMLRGLFARTESDPKLLAICERHQLLDYVVLFDALDRGFRLRLHVSTDDHFDRPHDHRFSFSSCIIAGSYCHTWYRPVPGLYNTSDEEALLPYIDRWHPDTITPIDVARCRPYLVRTETAGSCYSLHHSALHTTFTAPNTVSLFLRGPAEKRRSVIMDLQERTFWWRFGREEETVRRRETKLMPLPYIRSIRDRLEALGVL